jgi:hypothetical protein
LGADPRRTRACQPLGTAVCALRCEIWGVYPGSTPSIAGRVPHCGFGSVSGARRGAAKHGRRWPMAAARAAETWSLA